MRKSIASNIQPSIAARSARRWRVGRAKNHMGGNNGTVPGSYQILTQTSVPRRTITRVKRSPAETRLRPLEQSLMDSVRGAWHGVHHYDGGDRARYVAAAGRRALGRAIDR